MRPLVSVLLLCFLVLPALTTVEALQTAGYNTQASKNDEIDDDDGPLQTDTISDDEEDDDYDDYRSGPAGEFLGSHCNLTCNPSLHHVFCNPTTKICECKTKYPVKLGPTKGCAQPKKLGEQCYYTHTCMFMDQHSSCIQVNHNAICQCKTGYHLVTLQKPTKRVFCSEDLVLLTTNLSTLIGVFTGIAVLAGLICFVLRLFSQNHYERPRRFANANMPPPILYSSDTGIPLASNSAGRSTSRSSQRSGGTMISGYSRRPSSAQGGINGSRGVLVPSSRAGAARAAAILLISCHVNPHNNGGVLREESEERSSLASADPPMATIDDDDHDQHLMMVQRVEATTTQSVPNSPTQLGNTTGVRGKRLRTKIRDSGFNIFNKSASCRLGSRRPSMTSVHSTGSLRSYGGRMLEREREQREQRHEMQSRLARISSLPGSLPKVSTVPTPSPLSTDELLPSVCELREVTLSETDLRSSTLHGEIGPCSSKDCH